MFKYIVLLISLLLAGVAGFYSVFGLSHLFAGAFWAVVIMAGTIEVAKLVSANLLKKYWNDISWFVKIYLMVGTFGIMVLTSAGIYGFLTNAYQQTINKKSISDVGIKNAEFRKEAFAKQVEVELGSIEAAENRIDKLTEIRSGQEVRLDSLYAKSYYTTAKRTEKAIAEANEEIIKLNESMSESTNKIKQLNDSIAAYEIKIVELKTDETSAELGPLIYIAELTGRDMSEIINYFVLLIIVVFDPMAIILLISFNTLIEIDNRVDKEEVQIDETEIFETEDVPSDMQELIDDNWFDLVDEPSERVEEDAAALDIVPLEDEYKPKPLYKQSESFDTHIDEAKDRMKSKKDRYSSGFVHS